MMTDKPTPPFNLRGTPVELSDIREGRVLTVSWQPRAQYAWDTGVAIGRYLAELKNGRILGVHCRNCHRTVVPPRVFCELCWKPMDEWAQVQDTGMVNTFSLAQVSWDMQRLEQPEIPAVIDLDGTHPICGIMHRLGEVDPQVVHTGMRVQAVWKPPQEREGSITDIRYFKPI
jgi:hypothetical protein